MKVRAQSGETCPMEGKPKVHIIDDPDGTDVIDSPYYQRLITDGSLVEVLAAPEKPAKEKGGQSNA